MLNTHYVDYGMRSYLEEAGEIEGELKERNEEKDEWRRGSGKGEEEKVGDKTLKKAFIHHFCILHIFVAKKITTYCS